MDNINSQQVGGDHYASKSVQPWQAMESLDCLFLSRNVNDNNRHRSHMLLFDVGQNGKVILLK